MASVFHLALNVTDLEQARAFYVDLLGATEGRSTETWLDIDFFGHQVSLHLGEPFHTQPTGKVGNHLVPMPHFGVILPLEQFKALAQRLIDAKLVFEIEPFVRFKGEPGEQHTMFFRDPCGNPIEIKGFTDMSRIFAS
ncbi:VOC family protein [Hahella ganghwensis]|uniref:VOC family protein n=1 Tax=Hahella ganghwensis TaxID=286420 RepID=UPI0003634329|nr:VOC family protein [Hahella ganghwensis]